MSTVQDLFVAISAATPLKAMERPYLYSCFADDLRATNQVSREGRHSHSVAKAWEHIKNPNTPLPYVVTYYIILINGMHNWNESSPYISGAESAYKRLVLAACQSEDDFLLYYILPNLRSQLYDIHQRRRQDYYNYWGIELEDNFRERMRDHLIKVKEDLKTARKEAEEKREWLKAEEDVEYIFATYPDDEIDEIFFEMREEIAAHKKAKAEKEQDTTLTEFFQMMLKAPRDRQAIILTALEKAGHTHQEQDGRHEKELLSDEEEDCHGVGECDCLDVWEDWRNVFKKTSYNCIVERQLRGSFRLRRNLFCRWM